MPGFSPAVARGPGGGPRRLVEPRYDTGAVGPQTLTLDLLATSAVQAAVQEDTGRTLTAGSATVDVFTSAGVRLLTVTSSTPASAAVVRQTQPVRAAVTPAGATVVKALSRSLSAASAVVAAVTVSKTKLLSLTVSVATMAVVTRRASLVRTGTSAISGLLQTAAHRTVTALATVAVTIARDARKAFAAVSSVTGVFSTLRIRLVALLAATAAAASLRRVVAVDRDALVTTLPALVKVAPPQTLVAVTITEDTLVVAVVPSFVPSAQTPGSLIVVSPGALGGRSGERLAETAGLVVVSTGRQASTAPGAVSDEPGEIVPETPGGFA